MVAAQVCKQCVNKRAQRETDTWLFKRPTEGPLIPIAAHKQVVTIAGKICEVKKYICRRIINQEQLRKYPDWKNT